MVLIQMMDSEKYIKEDINMMGTNYGRRKEDAIKFNLIPTWMDKLMTICKYFLYTVPFLCCSIAMFFEGTNLGNSYMLTAVYCLSLLNLMRLTEK